MGEMISFRVEPELKKKIEKLSRDKIERRSDIIREALVNYIQRETELNEVKEVVAKKFAEGKISFDELVRVLGYNQAKKVAFYVDITESSFKEGLK